VKGNDAINIQLGKTISFIYIRVMSSSPPSSPPNAPNVPVDASSPPNAPNAPTVPSSPQNVPADTSSPQNTPNAPTVPSSNDPGYVVTNQQYSDASGNVYTDTQFITTDATSDVQITQDLSGEVVKYYDDTNDSCKQAIIAQIQAYAADIQCSSFHGKGTIDDYTQLFQAAAQIANDSSQMQLDVDIEGFNEFATAADELSALFNGFIVKLQNVSIIDDTAFLTAVANSLGKISNLSKVFGKFKETILATSTVHLPKSTQDASLLLKNVVGQINCAMNYITHFVDPSISAPAAAELSTEEKGIINAAVTTINNWNILCDQGVTIAMSNDTNIQYINGASEQLKQKTQTLKNSTSLLKSKLAAFNINNN
jgi:hypothetical protein